MPAAAPLIDGVLATRLGQLGARIREQRQRQKVTATAAAESAGLSRVTLHRIERGEPSVTIGAYLAVIDALGLTLELRDPSAASRDTAEPALPPRIRLADYPQLRALSWQLQGVDDVSPQDALALYERNWRHIDHARLDAAERALLRTLAQRLGGGRLLV